MTSVLIGLKIYTECCGLIYPFNRGCEHLVFSVCKETGSHFFCEIQVSSTIEKESSSQIALMHRSNYRQCKCRAIDAGCVLEMPTDAWIANKKRRHKGRLFGFSFWCRCLRTLPSYQTVGTVTSDSRISFGFPEFRVAIFSLIVRYSLETHRRIGTCKCM